MTDLLNIGSSGIRVYQNALEVVGDNITNANTVGYARREVGIRSGVIIGPGFPLARDFSGGSGVMVDGIRRAYDAFRTEDARVAGGDYSRLEARQRWLTELQTTFGSGSSSIGAGLTRFFNAAQDVAADPAANAPRVAFLEAADTLAVRFRAAAEGTAATLDGVRDEMRAKIVRTNELTGALAEVNRLLRRAGPQTADSAALRDQRDVIVDELASMMRISVDEKSNGSVELRLGDTNGPVLVKEDGAKLLVARTAGNKTEIVLDPFAGSVRAPITGGSLAGLIEAETRTVSMISQIDTLASGFVDAVNAQHALGLDLNGAQGSPMFAATRLFATPSPANSGGASVVVGIDDVSDIAEGGYDLTYDSSTKQWTLARADGTGTPAVGIGTLTLDGIRVEPGGAPAGGDSFAIVGRRGAAGVTRLVDDPARIAAAAIWRADRAPSNQGTTQVAVRVATPPVPLAAYQLRMATASTYEIVDPATSAVVGSGPYVAGDWIEVDGIEFQLSAGAGAGDSFALTRDPDGVPTPYASAAAGSNSGTASVDSRVAAAPVPLAAYDVRVVELAGVTSYEVLQAGTTTVLGSGPYVSSSWVGIDGLEFQLTGVPKVGDSFTVARNVDGAADNANIRDLVGLRLLEGGGFEQRYERQVTSLAAALANTKSLAEASKALRDSTVASRDSVMAVNLDREAADLLRYQQAYQACSKIISAAQTLFDTLVRL